MILVSYKDEYFAKTTCMKIGWKIRKLNCFEFNSCWYLKNQLMSETVKDKRNSSTFYLKLRKTMQRLNKNTYKFDENHKFYISVIYAEFPNLIPFSKWNRSIFLCFSFFLFCCQMKLNRSKLICNIVTPLYVFIYRVYLKKIID